MFPRFRIKWHVPYVLPLLIALTLGATALAPAADAANTAGFELAIGKVENACTGAHLGGAMLTFAPVGAPGLPPGPPTRVQTNPGGHFQTKLPAGDYNVAVALDGYSQVDNTDGDPVSIITIVTGRVSHFTFALYPPSPC